ncbi:MAG: PAS domain S-box protein [Candidatus Limnocylindria bacterium]
MAVDSETLLRVIATAADALYVVDRDGYVRFLNPAAAAILGYADPAELVGRPSHATIHYKHADGSPYPVEDCPMLRVRVTGQTLHTEEDWFVRMNGALVPVAYSSAPFHDGAGWGAVITFRDITERLRLDEVARRDAVERAHAEDVQMSRQRIAEASDTARKRIERDIHDGAQQQLIAVSLRLEEARAAARDDPESAAVVIDTARIELRVALQELRELARGIHPKVLTERGLAAALRALARRSAIPVDLDLHLTADRRLPPAVEGCAYFVICEAIANVQRHAQASHVTIHLKEDAESVRFSIADDGVGGATLGAGSGLTGARDRVDAMGGTLVISSPPTGPTILTGTVPFAPRNPASA